MLREVCMLEVERDRTALVGRDLDTMSDSGTVGGACRPALQTDEKAWNVQPLAFSDLSSLHSTSAG